MKYNHNGIPEENNDPSPLDNLKYAAIGVGVTIITCFLITTFLFIYKSC